MSWRSLADAVVGALPEGAFAAVVTGDEVAHGKPHPEPYRAAARLLGVSTRRTASPSRTRPPGCARPSRPGCRPLAVPHVVPVPEIAGAVHVESLAGMTPDRLAELAASASVVGGNGGA